MNGVSRQSAWVFGASGHARVVADILETADGDRYSIAGHIDGSCGGDRDEELPALVESTGVRSGIVAIGDNATRAGVAMRIAALIRGFDFITAIHRTAVVARGVHIGAGSVIAAGAILNTGSRVGRHAIVNTATILEHDAALGDFASTGPGVVLGGGASLGDYSFAGLGAKILHLRTVGNDVVLGAGSLVTRDIPERTVAYGTPARVIRARIPGERYL